MTEQPGPGDATTADFSDYYDVFKCTDDSTEDFSEGLFPVLYSTVFIVGLLGHAVVLWVLIRSRHRCSLTDVCLLNLAVSDLLFLVSLPVWAHSAMDQWVFGKFLCHTVTGLFTMGLYSSVFFMVLMTLDRYAIAVYKHSICSRTPTKVALASSVWTLSLFASLPNIVFARVKEEACIKTSCRSDFPEGAAWMSFTYLNFLSFILPLIITSVCFCRILGKSEDQHGMVRLLLAVLAIYFFFWAPYNIVRFLLFLKGYLMSSEGLVGLSLAEQWVEAIALSHCCVNPIIYACAGQKFRSAVRTVLHEQLSSSVSKNITCSPPSPESGSSEDPSTLIA